MNQNPIDSSSAEDDSDMALPDYRLVRKILSEEMVLNQLEALIRMVLSSPPPDVPNSDPDWARLFAWCHKHREVMARRARQIRRSPVRHVHGLDRWLLELASPPKGTWEGVRYGVMPFIRLVGMLPRPNGDAMFTGSGWKPEPRFRSLGGEAARPRLLENS